MGMPTADRRRKLKPGCFIQLQDMKDTARLACALERVALPIFSIEYNNENLLAIQMDLYGGMPVFYYSKTPEVKEVLAYRNSGGVEEVMLTDMATNPSWLYAPIISIVKVPPIFREGLERKASLDEKYLGFEVKSLASLAKVSSYKVAYEEPPIPVFEFKKKNHWILGCFTRMDDHEEASIFFYLSLDSPVTQSFIKYSAGRFQDVTFTNRTDEHGLLFIKIIKLNEEHPLVSI